MPLGRSGIGRWLGLSGEPEKNPAAGAVVAETDKDNNPIKWVDEDGNDVTEDAKKFGTGAVKRPSFAARIFNPVLSNRADILNTEYNTKPTMEKQQFGIEKGQAKNVIRSAIALRDDKKPSEVDDEEVERVFGATGTSARGGGVSPHALNQIHQDIVEGKLNVPEIKGQTSAETSQTDLNAAKAFNAAGGGTLQGRGRAALVKLGGEQAEMGSRVLPFEEKLQMGETKGRLGRMETEQSILDQEAINHLAKVHDVDPKTIQKAAIDASEALGRTADENAVHRYLLNQELTKATTLDKMRPELAQTYRNQVRQGLVESAQPPGSLLANPVLYNPNPKFSASDSIAKAYTRQPGMNPMFQPSIMAKMYGMQKLSDMVNGGGGGAVTLPGGGVVDTSQFGGGGVGNTERSASQQNPSAPATEAVTTPQTPAPSKPSIAFNMFRGTNNNPSMNLDDFQSGPNENSRLQYLLGRKKTYMLTPAEEAELARFPGQ